MSVASRAAKWKKKEVGDLVTPVEGGSWAAFSVDKSLVRAGVKLVPGRVGVVVRNDSVRVDVRVYVSTVTVTVEPPSDAVAAPRRSVISSGFSSSVKATPEKPAEEFELLDRQHRGKCWGVVSMPVGEVEIFVPEPSAFPLEQLPLSCLSVVLSALPLREAAALAVVSQRFRRAFNDEVAWRHRCEAEPGVMEHSDGTQSFRELFRQHGPWRIRVLSINRDGSRLASAEEHDSFYVMCRPTITVSQLQHLILNSRRMRMPLPRMDSLEPFDPRKVVQEKGRIPHAWLPDWPQPNCSFDASNPAADIRSAGLVPEAVLMVRRDNMHLD
jgi:hypothetical protein